jgi:hypothetical protein
MRRLISRICTACRDGQHRKPQSGLRVIAGIVVLGEALNTYKEALSGLRKR